MSKEDTYVMMVVDDSKLALKLGCSRVVSAIQGEAPDHIDELPNTIFNKDVKQVIRELFDAEGCGESDFRLFADKDRHIKIITARNGIEAFEKFREYCQQGGFVNAILTDHDMQGDSQDSEMDGSAFLHKVREYSFENGEGPEDMVVVSSKTSADITRHHGFEFRVQNAPEIRYINKDMDVGEKVKHFAKSSFEKWKNMSASHDNSDYKEDRAGSFHQDSKNFQFQEDEYREIDERDFYIPSSSPNSEFAQQQRSRSPSKESIMDF